MKEKIELHEVHEILLGIADEFHKICTAYNVPYFMLGGTMLGAVRHKGFIPWDDDMDFGVPREKFNVLIEILIKELSPNYNLKTIYNSTIIYNEPVKLEDIRTLVIEPSRTHCKEDLGVNIDIFPLDHTNGSKSFFSRNNMVHIIGLSNSMRYGSLKNLNVVRKVLAIAMKILLSPFKKTYLTNFAQKHLIKSGNYISNLYGYWGVKETVPETVMGTPSLYKFEDRYFYGPEKYDEYLSSLYGDYMKMPPEGQRHVHLENVFKK